MSKQQFLCVPLLEVLIIFLLFAIASDAQEIKQLSFVHRHGARDEPLVIDGNLVWDYAQLTPNGEKMMLNLGRLLRSVYGEFISYFDPAVYVALSGDSDRCIQSAHGVLRAFFDESNQFTPLVKHTPLETDWLMEFNYNFPNVFAREDWYYAYQRNDALARTVLSSQDLSVLSAQFGDWCMKTPMLCALFAVDALQCRISNTGMISSELTAIFNDKLLPLQYGNDKHMYGFNSSDPYAVIGSPAYTLVSKMLTDAGESDKKVYHYSAHDTTVLGVLNTFGSIQLDDADHKWFPRFGAVLTVTTYVNGNVSFAYAEPQQEADTNLDYVSGLPKLSVRCQTASGEEYIASQCPLKDVWNYVNRSKPTVSDRFCYLRPEDECSVKDVAPSSGCKYYRKHCPDNVCGPDAVLDPSQDYMCVSFDTKKGINDYAFPATLSGVAGVLAGLLIGLLIATVMTMGRRKEAQVNDV